MTDIALLYSQALQALDVAMWDGDLQADDSIATAVILSLLLDAPAQPGDVLPDPLSADRRGWWGNAFLPPVDGKPDVYGSRLWLLSRALQIPATLRAAEMYAAEALAWMIEDNVVASVLVSCTFPARGRMNINIKFVPLAGNDNFPIFDVPWFFAA
jgi:phage gp46-like protein